LLLSECATIDPPFRDCWPQHLLLLRGAFFVARNNRLGIIGARIRIRRRRESLFLSFFLSLIQINPKIAP
jgi:hypothetical protein